MKRYIVMLAIVLFFSYTMYADAREGTIEIISPLEDEIYFSYIKVAEIIDGEYFLIDEYKDCNVDLNKVETAKEMREVIEILEDCEVKTKNEIKTYEGKVVISELEEGVYLVESASSENLQISSMLVSIPFYDEETMEMSYDITVMPKWNVKTKSVETGDETVGNMFGALCAISLIFIVTFACHRYMEYARMRHKKNLSRRHQDESRKIDS